MRKLRNMKLDMSSSSDEEKKQNKKSTEASKQNQAQRKDTKPEESKSIISDDSKSNNNKSSVISSMTAKEETKKPPKKKIPIKGKMRNNMTNLDLSSSNDENIEEETKIIHNITEETKCIKSLKSDKNSEGDNSFNCSDSQSLIVIPNVESKHRDNISGEEFRKMFNDESSICKIQTDLSDLTEITILNDFDFNEHEFKRKEYGKSHIMMPRGYQESIVNMICHEADHCGRIISLETGLGKTFIALLVLCKKLNINYEIEKSKELKNRKQDYYFNNLKLKSTFSHHSSNTVFLVPTKNLLEQQKEYFCTHLPSTNFEVYSIKSSSDKIPGEKIFTDDKHNFVVMVHKVCLDLLRNGNMKIEDINCMIFDECHHAQKDHPYNLIMKEFYFYGVDFKADESQRYSKRPFILGLTASPIKTKLKQTSKLEFCCEMNEQLRELCSNLNSKIVSADLEHLDESLIKKLESKYFKFKTRDYLQSIDFVKDPMKYIPSIKDIIESYKNLYDESSFEKIKQSLEIFENEISIALKNRHHEIYMAPDITPEKITQIVGNHYKETLEKISLEEFPNEVRVAVIMCIAFFIYCNNILLNIGISGLACFINDFALKFKASEIKGKDVVIHKYLK